LKGGRLIVNLLDLEEEALELNPVFEQGVALEQPPRTVEPKQPLVCPNPARQIVSGFPRHANTVNSLPGAEQEKIRTTARLVLRSFQPGCQPILTVSLLGHADRDLQRGPAFEKRISEERAAAIQQALQSSINNPIVSRIRWQVMGAGAGSLIVPNAKTERERARNRRVEIFLGPIPLDGLIKGVTVDTRGASIRFAGEAAPRAGDFNFDLYRDQPGPPAPLLPRTEWMRRGAMLGLAQRAFTNGHRAKLVVANDIVQSIEIYKA
jgi:outer membrane protein OmpA-like peptidoglycan-associated protein